MFLFRGPWPISKNAQNIGRFTWDSVKAKTPGCLDFSSSISKIKNLRHLKQVIFHTSVYLKGYNTTIFGIPKKFSQMKFVSNEKHVSSYRIWRFPIHSSS